MQRAWHANARSAECSIHCERRARHARGSEQYRSRPPIRERALRLVTRRARTVPCAGQARVAEQPSAERDERGRRRGSVVRREGRSVERVWIEHRRRLGAPHATERVGVREQRRARGRDRARSGLRVVGDEREAVEMLEVRMRAQVRARVAQRERDAMPGIARHTARGHRTRHSTPPRPPPPRASRRATQPPRAPRRADRRDRTLRGRAWSRVRARCARSRARGAARCRGNGSDCAGGAPHRALSTRARATMCARWCRRVTERMIWNPAGEPSGRGGASPSSFSSGPFSECAIVGE